MRLLNRLLWVDCTAGGVVGGALLVLSGPLNELYALPREVVLFVGGANLLYATYSLSLARRDRRPMPLLMLLVAANLAWVPVCLGLAAAFWTSASVFGIAHLIGEAVFVGGLAVLEWRHRERLVTAA